MSDNEFKDLFPVTSNKELAQQTGTSIRSVIRRARALGVRKDASYIQEMGRQKLANTPVLKGENHPNWKGGKPWERFKDPRYLKWRDAILERDNYTCQECYRHCKKREKGLAAHHIKEYLTHPDLRYEVSNGLTLCRACHMKLHGKEYEVEMIPCACGCGTMIPSKDKYYGRPRKYVNFHAPKVIYKEKPRPSRVRDAGDKLIPCACGCGTMITPFGSGGKPRRYLYEHINLGRKKSQEMRHKLSEARKREHRPRNAKGQFT